MTGRICLKLNGMPYGMQNTDGRAETETKMDGLFLEMETRETSVRRMLGKRLGVGSSHFITTL